MKKLGLLLLPILAITLIMGGSAFAQNVGDSTVYFVTYYSNANVSGAPDGTLRLINDGDQATEASEGVENGTLWADIYVFDDSQEMISCCSCYVSSDGLLSESVNKELANNSLTFTGRAEVQRGVIKVISDRYLGNQESPTPLTGLRGWMTHIQATTNIPEKGPWFVTEAALADSNLGSIELTNLGTLCSYGLTIGSGYGTCPCTPEDYDF